MHGSDIWCLDDLVAAEQADPLSASAGSRHLFSFQVLPGILSLFHTMVIDLLV